LAQHTILVITDGEASDKGPLEKVLVSASHMISRDECLAISFIQVGQDRGARRFLKMLDDDLTGCKFDIVDTKACLYHHLSMSTSDVMIRSDLFSSPSTHRAVTRWPRSG
jgi:hypothetical protein